MQDELLINRIYNGVRSRIKPQWITAFVACMVIGLLTYGYTMANHFLTYDSMWNLYSDQNMISSGRQFLQFACGISSYYDLPWLNGVLAIFYLALTSVLVVEGLEIKSRVNAALVAGVIVTFPSVISTFAYTFTVDGYMLAALLSAAAFLVTDRVKKWGFAIGMILLGVSLGIYQAFFSFTIVLCILRLLLDILEQDKIKEIIGKALRYILMGVLGYLFYVVTLNLMLQMQGAELSGYQGTANVQSFSLSELPAGLHAAFMNFINFARWSNVLTTTEPMKLAFVALSILGAVCYAYLFFTKKRYRSPLHILITIILVVAIPFGATVVNIISADTFYHLLLRAAWCLFFAFIPALSERLELTSGDILNRVKYMVVAAISIFSIVLIFSFAQMASIVGYNMNERYEKSYALCLRIVDRLEQTPGYIHGMPVAILGGIPDAGIYPSTEQTGEDLVGYFGVSDDYVMNSTEKFAAFMSHYMNVTIQTVDYEKELEIVETEQFKEMEKFPAADCIQQIDGVWIVKLNG